MELAESAGDGAMLSEELGRLLVSMAVAAVGERHVDEDRFRAVNEALLPVLGDRIASMRLREIDSALWQTAFGEARANLSQGEAAKLNRQLHIAASDPNRSGAERGAVINLPEQFSGDIVSEQFELRPEEAAYRQYWYKPPSESSGSARWVLVQTQASCDYAQLQPGPLPFHLGLCLPASEIRSDGRPPAAVWSSPCFEFDGQSIYLHVNARFSVSLLRREVQKIPQLFRLRESLLSDLIYQIHGYSTRPGMIAFRNSR